MSRLFYFIVYLCVTACSSFAASGSVLTIGFVDSATVDDTLIRVKDVATLVKLNDESTMNILENIVIGESAPAGFCRRVSTQEIYTKLVKVMPRQYSLSKIQAKSITVKTNAKECKVADFEKEICSYISDSVLWDKGNYAITVRNSADSWKCLKQAFVVAVSGLSTRYPKGNVNLNINMRQGTRTYCIPVLCNVSVSVEVVIACSTISRGSLLTQDNCVLGKKDITRFGYEPFLSISDIGSYVATRTIPKETIIHNKLITKRPVIIKDDQVFVVSSQGPIRVSVIMRAREDGAVGDRIWVENPESHKLLKTKVVGKGRVSLLEGEKVI